MPGQIRDDINRMTNTVVSVAKEGLNTIRWVQAIARAAHDRGVAMDIENTSGEPPLKALAKFGTGEAKMFPFRFLFSVKPDEGDET